MVLKKWKDIISSDMGADHPDKNNDETVNFSKELSPLTNFSLDLFINTISQKNIIINFPNFKINSASLFSYIFATKYKKSIYMLTEEKGDSLNKNTNFSLNKNHYLIWGKYKEYIFHELPILYLKKLANNEKNLQNNPIEYKLSLEKYLPRAKNEFKSTYNENFVLNDNHHPKFILDRDNNLYSIKNKLNAILKSNNNINPQKFPIGLIIIENADRFFNSTGKIENFIKWFKELNKNIKLLIHFNNPNMDFIKILVKELNFIVIPFNKYILENNKYLKNKSMNYYNNLDLSKSELLNRYNLDSKININKNTNISIYNPLIYSGSIDLFFSSAYKTLKKIDINEISNEDSIFKAREILFILYNLTINPAYLKISFKKYGNNWTKDTIPHFIENFKNNLYKENKKNKFLIYNFLDSLTNMYYELANCKRVNENLSYSRKGKDYVLYKLLLNLTQNNEKVFVGTYNDTEPKLLKEILKKGNISKIESVTPIHMKMLIQKSNNEKKGKILILPGVIPEVFTSELFKPYKEIIILSYDGKNHEFLKDQLNKTIYGNIFEEKEYMDHLKEILKHFNENSYDEIFNDFNKRFELIKSEEKEQYDETNDNLTLNDYMKEWESSKTTTNSTYESYENKNSNDNPEKEIDINKNPNETKKQMNLLLNAISSGKTLEHALKIAKINQNTLDVWLDAAENKNEYYFGFYRKYYELIYTGKSQSANDNLMNIFYELKNKGKTIQFGTSIPKKDNIKMNVFIYAFHEKRKLKYALKLANLDINLFYKWIDDGQKKNNEYFKFYTEYQSIKNNTKTESNTELSSEEKALMKQFIFLKYDGKTNEEAIQILNMRPNLIKIWVNQAQMGNESYKKFYKAYNLNLEQNNEKELFKNNDNEIPIDNISKEKNINEKENIEEYNKIENKSKRIILLEQIKIGNSVESSCNYSSLDLNLFNEWILKGKENKKPYSEFYEKFNQIRHIIEEYNKSETKRTNFLEHLKFNGSIKKSCEKSLLDINIINYWLNLGEENIDPYSEFYNNYLESLEINFNQDKRNEFLEFIKQDYSISETCEKLSLDLSIINEWLKKENENKKPYQSFIKLFYKSQEISKLNKETEIKKDIIEIIKNGTTFKDAAKEYENGKYEEDILNWYRSGKNNENHEEFYNNVNLNLPNFFDLIKEKYSIKMACKKANLEYEDIKNKIRLKENPFYNNLVEAKILNKIREYPKISSNKTDHERIIKTMNEFIELLIKGNTIKNTCEKIDLPYETYKIWIKKGINKLDEIYIDFYNELKRIAELKNNIENTLKESFAKNEILDMIPEKDVKKIPKNDTGFAWVEKTNRKWIYKKNKDEKHVKYSHNDIYKLFNIIINSNEKWGVIDIKKAENSLKNPIIKNIHNYQTVEFDNKNNKFKYVKMDNNLNQLNNASNENNEKKHDDENNKTIQNDNEKSSEINYENILKPLPEEIEKKLRKYSKGNKSGFAWVNQIGDQWIYTRKIDKNIIKITDENIYILYEKVIKNNYEWGVRNIIKAKKSLEPYSRPENNIKIIKPNTEEYDILIPLPEKYEFLFKSTKMNKSGFAWVNKTGNVWSYSRNINGKFIKISDENIFNLHEKIISQNLVWGVRDILKAKETIKNEKHKQKKEDIESEVTVNYLTNEENDVNITIKGTISDNGLFIILSKLKIFEDNIKRILTNKINNKIEIIIELNLEIELLNKFEKEIRNLGWTIN